MRVTRFGHSAVLVEVAGQRVLIDPGSFSADAVFDLTDLAAIVVTHQHPDHLDASRIPRLLDANPAAVLLADPESAAQATVGAWQSNADGKVILLGDVTIGGIGSTHAQITPGIPRVANVGVVITAHGQPRLFHPGDTYEHAPGGVDVLALPLAAPWTKISETIDFVHRVSPSAMFPIHDRTISELAYPIYWNHAVNFGGVEDSRPLGQHESTDFNT